MFSTASPVCRPQRRRQSVCLTTRSLRVRPPSAPLHSVTRVFASPPAPRAVRVLRLGSPRRLRPAAAPRPGAAVPARGRGRACTDPAAGTDKLEDARRPAGVCGGVATTRTAAAGGGVSAAAHARHGPEAEFGRRSDSFLLGCSPPADSESARFTSGVAPCCPAVGARLGLGLGLGAAQADSEVDFRGPGRQPGPPAGGARDWQPGTDDDSSASGGGPAGGGRRAGSQLP